MPSDNLTEILAATLAVELGMAASRQVAWAWDMEDTLDLAGRLEKIGAISPEQRLLLDREVAEVMQDESAALQKTQRAGRPAGADEESTERVLPPLRDQGVAPGLVPPEDPRRYSFLSLLGRGGHARVYRVLDGQFGREIAFKEMTPLSTPGESDPESTREVQRFLREARITGQLTHPNIVPVHELGRRQSGFPYYTMQLVEGHTLAAKLDGCQTLQERVKHLGSVWDLCNALAFAHSQGVIHRDIKPQNVMVGPFGETVVLDWGLAKVRSSEEPEDEEFRKRAREWNLTGGETMTGSMMGTPSYMSPEQIEGRIADIDECSDVWGLGAVLYRLLTGAPPVEGVDLEEIAEKLVNRPVRPVAELCPQAPPELAAIAEKALNRDRKQRYRDAGEMAAEVSAYMTGSRVGAYSYSAWELIRRFVGRYRIAFSVGGLAFLLLLVTGVIAFLQVRTERGEARRQRDEASRFANLMVTDLFDQVMPLAGSTPALETLSGSALEYYQDLAEPGRGTREDRLALARTYRTIGWVASEKGKAGDAGRAYEKASSILQGLLQESPGDSGVRERLTIIRRRQAEMAAKEGRIEEARRHYQAALAMAESLAEEKPADSRTQSHLLEILKQQGNMELRSGRLERARALHQRQLELTERLHRQAPDDDLLLEYLGYAYNYLSRVAQAEGELSEARELIRKDLEVSRQRLVSRPDDMYIQRSIMVGSIKLGQLAMDAGDLKEAEASFGQSVNISGRLARLDPSNVQRQRDHAGCLHYLSLVQEERGDREQALATYRNVLTSSRRMVILSPGETERKLDLAATLQRMGDLAWATGQADASRKYYLECLDTIEPLTGDNTFRMEALRQRATAWLRMGDLIVQTGGKESGEWFKRARAETERLHAESPREAANQRLMVGILQRTGGIPSAIEIAKALYEKDKKSAENAAMLLQACVLAGRYQQAVSLGERTLELNQQRPGLTVVLHLLLTWSHALLDQPGPVGEHANRAAGLVADLPAGPSLDSWSPVPALVALSQLKHPRARTLRPLFFALQGWAAGEGPDRVVKELQPFLASP